MQAGEQRKAIKLLFEMSVIKGRRRSLYKGERLRDRRSRTPVCEPVAVSINSEASAHSIARAKHEEPLAERRVSGCARHAAGSYSKVGTSVRKNVHVRLFAQIEVAQMPTYGVHEDSGGAIRCGCN